MIKIPITSEPGKGMGCIRVPSTPIVAQSDIITRHFRGKFLARAEPKPSSESVEWIEYTYFNSIGVDILTESSEIAQNITDVDWADLKVLADTLSIRQHNADDGDTLRVAAKEFALPRWNEERNCFRYCLDPVTNQKHLVIMWGIFEKLYGSPVRMSASPTSTCEPTIINAARERTPTPPLPPGPIGPNDGPSDPPPNPTTGIDWAWVVLGSLLIILLMLLLRNCVDSEFLTKPTSTESAPIASSPSGSPVSRTIDPEPSPPPAVTGNETNDFIEASTNSPVSPKLVAEPQTNDTIIADFPDETVIAVIINSTKSNSIPPLVKKTGDLADVDPYDTKPHERVRHKWTMINGPPLANDPGEERLPPELQSGSITSGYVKVRLNHEVYDENDELIITQEIDWIYERE